MGLVGCLFVIPHHLLQEMKEYLMVSTCGVCGLWGGSVSHCLSSVSSRLMMVVVVAVVNVEGLLVVMA